MLYITNQFILSYEADYINSLNKDLAFFQQDWRSVEDCATFILNHNDYDESVDVKLEWWDQSEIWHLVIIKLV